MPIESNASKYDVMLDIDRIRSWRMHPHDSFTNEWATSQSGLLFPRRLKEALVEPPATTQATDPGNTAERSSASAAWVAIVFTLVSLVATFIGIQIQLADANTNSTSLYAQLQQEDLSLRDRFDAQVTEEKRPPMASLVWWWRYGDDLFITNMSTAPILYVYRYQRAT